MLKWLLVPLAGVLAFTATYNYPAPAKEVVAPVVVHKPVIYPCLVENGGRWLPCDKVYADPQLWMAAEVEV